ncbi:MAG: Ig-like domain-containing protein, partial [Anaerolineales bacterium]
MNEGLTLDQRLPDDEGRQPSRSLLFWLIWALIVFVILFACGSLAMLIENQQDRVEIQPAIQADYGVWPDSVRFGAVNLDLLEEIGRDRGFKISYSEGVSDGCFLPGSCNTATPTSSPYPTATATVTDVPTITQTPTATPSPTSTFPPTFTPTVTNTPVPPTNTPTSTPIVWPLKLVNPGNVDPEGDVVSVTILVVNYGNLTGAELTRVTDRLPAGMTFVPGSCSMSPGPVVPCSATGSEVSWSFSPARIIPHTRFITFTLQANISGISAGDVLTNIAETEGDNFATATYHRRIYAYTPTPTSTPITIPNAVDDAYSTTEDLPLIVSTPGLLSNDTDASWDTLTTTLDTPPSHGIAVVNLDGSFSYTPTANYFGTDSFTYLACDAGASCDGATVDLMINAVPDSPNAQDDSYSVDEDQSLSISAAGVLINDVDPDNLVPPLWSGLVVNSSPLVGPSHAAVGSFTLNADGSFDYSPAPDYFGPDQFTYQVCDTPLPGSCDTATAYITVNSVNDLPVALDDFSSTDEDVGVTIDVLSNDSDVLDGDPLSVDSVTQGGHGSVTHTAGDVTYTPDANWFGTDTFTYTISDGNGGFATASVEVTVNSVNDDPVAVDDPWPATPPILIGQGGTIRVDVWSNDYEDPVEGDSLYVGAILSPPASGGLSTAVIDDAGSPGYVLDDHSVIYTPDPTFHDP